MISRLFFRFPKDKGQLLGFILTRLPASSLAILASAHELYILSILTDLESFQCAVL